MPIIKVYTIFTHKVAHLKIPTGTSLSSPNTSKLKWKVKLGCNKLGKRPIFKCFHLVLRYDPTYTPTHLQVVSIRVSLTGLEGGYVVYTTQ